jgi:hypothetical protein
MKGWNGASRREFNPTLDSDPDVVALRGKADLDKVLLFPFI